MISYECTTFPAVRSAISKNFIAKTFEHKLWVKCLAEFLTEIKFYKKTEDANVDETMENPWQ